jgi:aryl-alcohol dehydrogenase-like predicted oxidoreductase
MLNPTAMETAGPGWNSTDFNGLLKKCAAEDMGVMGIRIFAASHLAARERHGREIPITANADNAAEAARAQAAMDIVGARYGTSAQAALRFGLACPLLSTIVVGIGEPWHLEQALGATRMGPLPYEALSELEKVRIEHHAFRR